MIVSLQSGVVPTKWYCFSVMINAPHVITVWILYFERTDLQCHFFVVVCTLLVIDSDALFSQILNLSLTLLLAYMPFFHMIRVMALD